MNIVNRFLTDEEVATLGFDKSHIFAIAEDTDANKIAAIFSLDLNRRGQWCGDFEGALLPKCTGKCAAGFVASAAEEYRGNGILPALAYWAKAEMGIDRLYVGPQEKLPPRVMSIFWQVGVIVPPGSNISEDHSIYENTKLTDAMIVRISNELGFDT